MYGTYSVPIRHEKARYSFMLSSSFEFHTSEGMG